MAEPTNPGQPSDSSTERGSPVNVETSGNVSVTRKDVATGDVKDLQATLLKQLVDCCDAQTDILKTVLEKTKDEIGKVVKEAEEASKDGAKSDDTVLKQLKELNTSMKGMLAKQTSGGGGDGEGGGGPSGGINYGGIKASEAQLNLLKDLGDEIEQGSLPALKNFGQLFKTGVMSTFKANMHDINNSIVQFGASLTDIQGAFRKTIGVVDEMFKSGQGGMIDITALYEDLGAGLIKNRDALSATLPVVKDFAEQSRTLIGTLGTNLEEVARSFKENREAAKEAFGNEFLERIPFDELNSIQTQMLEQARRAGVKATDNEILTSQHARSQMQVLKDISFATGKTVEEVMKLQETEGMTLEELRANGLIDEQTRDNMLISAGVFKTQGLEGITQLTQSIAEAGGLAQFTGKTEGAGLMMGRGNNAELIKELIAINKSQAGGTTEGMQRMVEIAAQLKGLEGLSQGVAGETRTEFSKSLMNAQINAQRVIGSQDELRRKGMDPSVLLTAQQKDTEGGFGGGAQGMFNTVKEMLVNNLGGGGDLAIALSFNTAAIIANTIAHGGGGLIKGMFKGGGKMLSKIPGVGKLMGMLGVGGATAAGLNVATSGAEAGADKILKGTKLTSSLGATDGAAKKVGAKSTAKFAGKAGAKSLLKKIPIIGLLAGLGFAAGRLMDGDFLGAGMEVASGAASLVPGIGTAASVALDAGLIARDMNMSEEGVGVPPVSDTKGVAGRGRGKSTVAPSGVASSPPATSVNANTAYGQLAAQTMHLAALVQLTTQGNQTRLDMLDTIGHSGAQTGKPTLWGAVTNTNSAELFTPLLNSGRSLRQG